MTNSNISDNMHPCLAIVNVTGGLNQLSDANIDNNVAITVIDGRMW